MWKIYLHRIVIYCVGLFLVALGVALSIVSDLGVSPVNSLPYVVSGISGINIGLCTTIIFTCFILLQALLLKSKFRSCSMLQLISATVFGCFVNAAKFMTRLIPTPSSYIIQLIWMMISVTVIGIGVFLYLQVDLFPLPSEGLMLAISVRFHLKQSSAKIVFDTSLVCSSVLLSLLLLHHIEGVREGTLIAAFGVGSVMSVIQKCKNHFIRDEESIASVK